MEKGVKMRVLILTTVLAPYRVDLFNELGKRIKLDVCFEQTEDRIRNDRFVSFKNI